MGPVHRCRKSSEARSWKRRTGIAPASCGEQAIFATWTGDFYGGSPQGSSRPVRHHCFGLLFGAPVSHSSRPQSILIEGRTASRRIRIGECLRGSKLMQRSSNRCSGAPRKERGPPRSSWPERLICQRWFERAGNSNRHRRFAAGAGGHHGNLDAAPSTPCERRSQRCSPFSPSDGAADCGPRPRVIRL